MCCSLPRPVCPPPGMPGWRTQCIPVLAVRAEAKRAPSPGSVAIVNKITFTGGRFILRGAPPGKRPLEISQA